MQNYVGEKTAGRMRVVVDEADNGFVVVEKKCFCPNTGVDKGFMEEQRYRLEDLDANIAGHQAMVEGLTAIKADAEAALAAVPVEPETPVEDVVE